MRSYEVQDVMSLREAVKEKEGWGSGVVVLDAVNRDKRVLLGHGVERGKALKHFGYRVL